MGNYIHYIYMSPVFARIRFGDWHGLLDAPPADEKYVYARLLWHLGRGMAHAGLHNTDSAFKELEIVEKLTSESVLALPFTPFSSANEGALVARDILKGTILLKNGNVDEAERSFLAAAEREDLMVYNEPRDWMLNPKHFLANAYIQSGKFDEAVNVLTKDLLGNNENGWALTGMYQALKKNGKDEQASGVLQRLRKAFASSDAGIIGPVF